MSKLGYADRQTDVKIVVLRAEVVERVNEYEKTRIRQ